MNKKLKSDLIEYIYSLKNEKSQFHFLPAADGLTNWGKKIRLGFSCFAIKCFYMLGEWDSLEDNKKSNWIDYINSFQIKNDKYIENSYVDEVFLDYYQSFDLQRDIKNLLKSGINIILPNRYESKNDRLAKTFVAESKQAIATLNQIGSVNKLPYYEFPQRDHDINNYLNRFNWNRPWNAGAQFASICVFSSTQLKNEDKKQSFSILENFINNKLNHDSGLYFTGQYPGSVESINGAMKVLTGLEWINVNIHFPKKIIDYCLENKPNSEGCDLVDIIYVLYRCSSETDYRKKDISNYFDELERKIMNHYRPEEGGFSYFLNKSQTHYYNLPISKGENFADLHGTTLLLWAITLINNFRESEEKIFNIIKA